MRSLSLKRSPYFHYLEEDENFRRWVEAPERGSITTASVYFRKAAYACEDLKTTPKEPGFRPEKNGPKFQVERNSARDRVFDGNTEQWSSMGGNALTRFPLLSPYLWHEPSGTFRVPFVVFAEFAQEVLFFIPYRSGYESQTSLSRPRLYLPICEKEEWHRQ